MNKRVTIKDLPLDERPRERMKRLGAESLSNAELLAILLRSGTREETALQLAEKILAKVSGLRNLPSLTVEELQEVKGIGLAKAVQIKASLELGRRIATTLRDFHKGITSPQDAAALCMEDMRYYDKEHFKIILLNTKNQVISIELISIGSLNASIVHPREIFAMPIRKSAASIILAHNHPSGDPAPSNEDLKVTQRLVEAGKLLGIEVIDHIVIGEGCFFSFREKGLLDVSEYKQ